MSRRVVLHVGAMKTGTSFVQSVLATHRDLLADGGVDYPPASPMAVLDVLKLPNRPVVNRRKWQDLAASAADGRDLLVSMEFLSFAKPRHVAAFLEPFADDRVEVVVSVRDQLSAIPAQWQTYCRNLGTEAWPDYLRSIEPPTGAAAWVARHPRLARLTGRPAAAARPSRAAMTFNRAQGIPEFVGRWRGSVDRVSIVTVPPSGSPPDVLWQRFAAAAGLPPIEVDLGLVHSNPSLGYGSCDLLRRVNAHLGDVPPRTYRRGIRSLSREHLVLRRGEESKPRLDRGGVEHALRLNAQVRGFVESSGLEVFGDLTDLPLDVAGTPLADAPERAVPVPQEETRAAARSAIAHLSERLDEDAATGAADPGGLDALVARTVELLRRVNRWPGPRGS